MVDWVHGHATDRRADTTPAGGTGLADLAQAILAVADFAQGCTALDVDATDFAGTQTNLCVDAFTGQQLCGTTGGTSDLTALDRKSNV